MAILMGHVTQQYQLKHYVSWLVDELKDQSKNSFQLECGPMPNVMVALPNIGGALCSSPQSLADAHY